MKEERDRDATGNLSFLIWNASNVLRYDPEMAEILIKTTWTRWSILDCLLSNEFQLCVTVQRARNAVTALRDEERRVRPTVRNLLLFTASNDKKGQFSSQRAEILVKM